MWVIIYAKGHRFVHGEWGSGGNLLYGVTVELLHSGKIFLHLLFTNWIVISDKCHIYAY